MIGDAEQLSGRRYRKPLRWLALRLVKYFGARQPLGIVEQGGFCGKLTFCFLLSRIDAQTSGSDVVAEESTITADDNGERFRLVFWLMMMPLS